MGWICGLYGVHNAYRLFVGKTERKREIIGVGGGRLGVERRITRDTDLTEIECESVDWIYVFVDRDKWWNFVNTGMNLWVSSNMGKIFIDNLLASQENFAT